MTYFPLNLANGDTIPLGGQTWGAKNDGQPYSLQMSPGYDAMRFEAATGEYGPGDPATDIRSQLWGPTIPANTAYLCSFDFMMEPGVAADLSWLILWEINRAGESPLLALDAKFVNGAWVLSVDWNFQAPGGPVVYSSLAKVSFTPGHVYSCQIAFVDAMGLPTGAASITLDGAPIVNETGIVTGYASATVPAHPSLGIYGGVVKPAPMPQIDIVAWYLSPSFK